MQGTKTGTSCDDAGKCQCKTENIVGDKCDSCKTNHYGFPNCKGTFFWNSTTLNSLINE